MIAITAVTPVILRLMKVIKEEDVPIVPITLRIPQDLLDRVTNLAESNEISRQKLVAAILEQVIEDEKFVLKVKGLGN